MQWKGRWTKGEYTAAGWSAVRRRPFWPLVTCACALLLAFSNPAGTFSVKAAILFETLAVGFTYFSLRRRIGKGFRRVQGQEFALAVDGQGVTVETSGSRGAIAWAEIRGVTADSRFVWFWLRKGRFLVFPAHGMNEAQKSELRALCADHCPRAVAR